MVAVKEVSEFLLKLSWRDKVLLSLLAAGAVAETFPCDLNIPRPTLSSAWRLGYGCSFEESPYFRREPKRWREELSRLLKKKWVEYKGERGNRCYLLTEEGLNQLFAGFPLLKHRQKPWDGNWRLVVYDIKESEKQMRERLRTELKRLGFVFIQKSVWLTPFSVEEDLKKFLRAQGLWGRILVFKAQLPPNESRRLIKLYGEGPSLSPADKKDAAFLKPLRNLFSYDAS